VGERALFRLGVSNQWATRLPDLWSNLVICSLFTLRVSPWVYFSAILSTIFYFLLRVHCRVVLLPATPSCVRRPADDTRFLNDNDCSMNAWDIPWMKSNVLWMMTIVPWSLLECTGWLCKAGGENASPSCVTGVTVQVTNATPSLLPSTCMHTVANPKNVIKKSVSVMHKLCISWDAQIEWAVPTRLLTRLLIHMLASLSTFLLPYSLPYSLTHLLTCLLTYSLAYSFTYSRTYSLSYLLRALTVGVLETGGCLQMSSSGSCSPLEAGSGRCSRSGPCCPALHTSMNSAQYMYALHSPLHLKA
jgi:hypothetical protein